MSLIAATLALICLALALVMFACAGESESGEHREGAESGEHREGAESGGEGDEESATQYAMNATYDETRAGARLILTYEAGANAFVGTVINTTDATQKSVRVEVHLSNGTELGPTVPTDLAPGESASVSLPATEESFSTWSAHPEVG